MLRHFPYAQLQFLKLGGLQVLRNLFREKGMETLYVRVVTLLYDLIVEKVREGCGAVCWSPRSLDASEEVSYTPGSEEMHVNWEYV